MFCVQGQFPKDSLEEWGVGVWGQPANGPGSEAAGWDAIFSHANSGKEIVYALSWLDNPNTIKPASALGSGFCHCQSLWYSEEMLAQEGQQSLISKCIWNPLSFLLEPLQNHSGYKPFFFFFPSVVASVTETSTTGSFSRETLASVVQRLSMLGPDGGNCISLESPSGYRLSSATTWEQEAIAGCSFSRGRRAAYGVLCVTQMVNFHQLFCSFSNSGIRRDRFLTIPSNISQSYFPSLCFCSAVSLSAALFCLEVNTWLGIEGGFNCFDFFLLLLLCRVTETVISNLEIVLNVCVQTLHTHTHTNMLTPFHIMFINDCGTILVHMD